MPRRTVDKPIVLPEFGLLASESDINAADDKVAQELLGRMVLLLDRFGIPFTPPDCWYPLALRLAMRYEPSCRLVRKSGAKGKWSLTDRAELKLAVQTLAGPSPTHGQIVRALGQLARTEPWKSKVTTRSSRKNARTEALRQQYYRADDDLVEVARSSRRTPRHS